MNKKLLIAVFVSAMAHTFACAASPKENRMKTVWADKVTLEMYGRVIRVLSYNVRNG